MNKYSPVQIEKLCTYLQSVGDVDYYEHPYGGDEVPVIAILEIHGERIAYQTEYFDPFNEIDTGYVIEEGYEAYTLHTSDITDEEAAYDY